MYTLKKLFEIESHCLQMLYSGVMFYWKTLMVQFQFIHGSCIFGVRTVMVTVASKNS